MNKQVKIILGEILLPTIFIWWVVTAFVLLFVRVISAYSDIAFILLISLVICSPE